MRKRIIKIGLVSAMTLLLASCSPYASLNVSAPFKVGPVYVNPSIGVGGSL
ncbi:hypothetical protein NQT69_04540 [Pseudoalteromonas shioyasakiensis]|uniref:hypothetical protein n=1 Tax=Pseudoalteromonas shioyasakiensis TaxID=1190813 RepID=UPI00211941DF|nr:hypothetical protein [Pseudoalteromonas shioyasakiensis]MCQ8877303.1 hypothetical protein [Pseudoalteromonas shioyasakiensis]